MTFRSWTPWGLTLAAALFLAACGGEDQTGAATQDGTGARTGPAPSAAAADAAPIFAHDASDIEPDPSVRYGVLDNGMRYAIVENETPPNQASVRFIFNAGAIAEGPDRQEIAHFLEHMNFNGTTNVPEGEMVKLLERYGLAFGADTNAFTGQEATGYLLELPEASEQLLEVGLFLMRETASEMTFDPEAIDRERGIIIGETRARNQPLRRFFQARLEFLYPGTEIAKSLEPTPDEVVQNLPREAFTSFYDDYYAPERALLVVVGDVDADVIEDKIKNGFDIEIPGLEVSQVESFETWEPSGYVPVEYGELPDFDEANFGYFHDPDVFTLVTVDVLERAEPLPDTRANRRTELLYQLGNSILQRRIQSQINSGTSPLVQVQGGWSNEYDRVNSTGLLAITSPDRWEEALGVLEQEIRRASEYGFTEAELAEQLANVRTSLQDGADQAATRDNSTIAGGIFQAWLNQDVYFAPQDALDWFNEIEDELTVEAVEAAFKDIWTANPPQVFLAAPVELDNGADAVEAAWNASKETEVTPPVEAEAVTFAYGDFGEPGAVASRTTVEDLGVDQIVFENGVRLNVKTTDFEDNVVRVRVDFGAGSLTPQPTPAAGSILANVFIGGGLEAHDADALQRVFAGKSLSYNLGVSDESFVLSGVTTPSDAQLQMQALAAFLTAPGWREEGLTRFRAIASEIRRNNNASTVSTAVNRIFRDVASGDPRVGFPTEEEVAAFSLEAGKAMLDPALDDAPLEITIVGDIEADRAVELVAATFGALPARAEDFPAYEDNAVRSFVGANEEPAVVRFNGQPDQAMANVFWPTTDGEDERAERVHQMMARIMQLKAIDLLREELGATYSPIIAGVQSETFADYGFVWAGVDVTPDNLDAVYDALDRIAAEMASGGITEDEVQRARQPILESVEENFERNQFWIASLAGGQKDPAKLEEIRTLRADYEAITREEIVALAERYLDPSRAYRASVLAQDVAGR